MAFGNFKNKQIIKKIKKKCICCIFVFFTTLNFFSQTNSNEEKIYVATEQFTAKPNLQNLEKLICFEQKIQPKTKAEQLATVILNCNKAYYQNQFGQMQNAILSYEKAWRIFNTFKLTNYDIVEYCLKPLGNLYTQIGDFENAENTIKNYFFIVEENQNENQKISAIQNLAVVYFSSGKHDAAISLLTNELKSKKLTPSQRGVLLANCGANYLALHKNVVAKETFKKSILLLKSDPNQIEALANSYRNLSKIYSAENNFTLASENFKKAKKLSIYLKNKSIRQQATILLEEATLNFNANKLPETELCLQKLFMLLLPKYSGNYNIPDKKSLYAETVLLDAFDLRAQIYLQQKYYQKALQWYDLSFETDKLLQLVVIYENSKILMQIGTKNRVEKCIALYEKLYQTDHNATYLEKAFQLCQQNKSIVLQNEFVQNKTRSKAEKALLEMLQIQNKIIFDQQQKQDDANIKIINTAINKQNQIMLLLKQQTKKNDQGITEINLELVYKKLKKDEAILISYFYGTEKIYCFTLENESIKLQSIESLKFKITAFLDYFSNADKITDNVAGYIKCGTALFNYLHLPSNQNKKNLVIIPDGLLNFVPFEALVTKNTSTTNFSKINYLINDFNIAYATTISFYLADNQNKKSNIKILGVFPIFENSDSELLYSKEEMKAIQNNFDGLFLKNAQATYKNFKQNAANFSIIHLSTHGSSGATDEPATIKFYDKTVLYSELYYLNLNADLVVLSACETGLGKLYSSEGAMSISRGFQMAGAKNLLFSLWKVNDYTTSVFMAKFYKNLKNNQSYFDANHASKLQYLQDTSISNAKKSPYYWCAMVYYGNLQKSSAGDTYYFYAAVGLFLLLIIFLNIKKGSHF